MFSRLFGSPPKVVKGPENLGAPARSGLTKDHMVPYINDKNELIINDGKIKIKLNIGACISFRKKIGPRTIQITGKITSINHKASTIYYTDLISEEEIPLQVVNLPDTVAEKLVMKHCPIGPVMTTNPMFNPKRATTRSNTPPSNSSIVNSNNSNNNNSPPPPRPTRNITNLKTPRMKPLPIPSNNSFERTNNPMFNNERREKANANANAKQLEELEERANEICTLIKNLLDDTTKYVLEEELASQGRMYKSNAEMRGNKLEPIRGPINLDNLIYFAVLIYDNVVEGALDLSPAEEAKKVYNWLRVLSYNQNDLYLLISKFVVGEPNLEGLNADYLNYSEEQIMELAALFPDETGFSKAQKYELDKRRNAYMKKKQQTGVGGRRTKKRVQRKKSNASKSRRRR